MIKVYTTPICPYCHALKEFLKERNIEYEEVDVSKDESKVKELIEKSGQLGVPVVDINGKVVIGFDRQKICDILGIKE